MRIRRVVTLLALLSAPAVIACAARDRPAPNLANDAHAATTSRVDPRAPEMAASAAEQWRARWPAATQALAEWAEMYPTADAVMREWDASGERFETFLQWAIEHPSGDFHEFLRNRSAGAKMEETLAHRDHGVAMGTFLVIVRRNETAFLELAHLPNAFAWREIHPSRAALSGAQTGDRSAPASDGVTNRQPSSPTATSSSSAVPR
jgi:hypothetical protein